MADSSEKYPYKWCGFNKGLPQRTRTLAIGVNYQIYPEVEGLVRLVDVQTNYGVFRYWN
jgi:hypothetical protein